MADARLKGNYGHSTVRLSLEKKNDEVGTYSPR